MSRPRCASAPASAWVRPYLSSARPTFLNASSTQPCRSCSWPYRTIPVLLLRIELSLRAMPIWNDWTKRIRSSQSCAPLLLRSCPTNRQCLGVFPSIANCSCRGCAWRLAGRDEPDSATCRDPRTDVGEHSCSLASVAVNIACTGETYYLFGNRRLCVPEWHQLCIPWMISIFKRYLVAIEAGVEPGNFALCLDLGLSASNVLGSDDRLGSGDIWLCGRTNSKKQV